MGFDRSRFKTTKKVALEKQEQVQQEKRPKGKGSGNSDRLPNHTYDEGKNEFRIFPFHPDGGGASFVEAKCVSFLPKEMPKYDKNNKPVEGEKVIRPYPVFNAKVHSSKVKKDLVEEYMNFVRNHILPQYEEDQEEADRIWKMITGHNGGIKPSDSWQAYANKITDAGSVFGEMTIKTSIKTKMKEAAADIEEIDPFTDVEDGVPVVIEKDSVAGKSDASLYYSVSLKKEKVGKRGFELVPAPLNDEDIENLLEQPSLYKKYRDVYTKKDFEMQLNGLQLFDKGYSARDPKTKEIICDPDRAIGVFDYDEWIDIVQEIHDTVPDDPSPAEQNNQPNKSESDDLPWDKSEEAPLKGNFRGDDSEDEDTDDVEEKEERPTRRRAGKGGRASDKSDVNSRLDDIMGKLPK